MGSGPADPEMSSASGNKPAAQVQPAVADFGLVVESVTLVLAGADEVHDLVAAGDEQLRDQPAMTPPPRRLCAHEARRGLGKHVRQRLLPLGLPHPRRVAAEPRDAQARELLLARLAAPPPTELRGVPIFDPGLRQRLGESRLVVLRMAP